MRRCLSRDLAAFADAVDDRGVRLPVPLRDRAGPGPLLTDQLRAQEPRCPIPGGPGARSARC